MTFDPVTDTELAPARESYLSNGNYRMPHCIVGKRRHRDGNRSLYASRKDHCTYDERVHVHENIS